MDQFCINESHKLIRHLRLDEPSAISNDFFNDFFFIDAYIIIQAHVYILVHELNTTKTSYSI
jgi:hypothetical protein